MRRKDLLGQFLPKARAKGFFDSLRDLILEEPVFLPDYRDFVFQPQIFNGISQMVPSQSSLWTALL